MNPVMTIALAALLSAVLVGIVRRYALRSGILDQPNSRSSHAVPTPRGGGAGLLAATFVMFAVTGPEPSVMNWRLLLAFFGILLTALVGWLDDRNGLGISWRLCVHVVSGLLLLPLALVPGQRNSATLVQGMSWTIATPSAINVVNFIDGIDGLIALQGVVFGLHLAALTEFPTAGAVLGAVMGGACLGFLLWNWAPARIFLGDVGSGPLGILGLVGGILVWQTGRWPLLAIFLPALPIFLDASITILRRACMGERLHRPHRMHLYQRLANEGWGHARVALLYGVASGLGAAAAHAAHTPAWSVIAVAYIVIIVAAGIALDRRVPFRRVR